MPPVRIIFCREGPKDAVLLDFINYLVRERKDCEVFYSDSLSLSNPIPVHSVSRWHEYVLNKEIHVGFPDSYDSDTDTDDDWVRELTDKEAAVAEPRRYNDEISYGLFAAPPS